MKARQLIEADEPDDKDELLAGAPTRTIIHNQHLLTMGQRRYWDALAQRGLADVIDPWRLPLA